MKKVLLFSAICIAMLLTGCSKDGNNNPLDDNGLFNGITGKNEKRLVCNQKVQTVDVDMYADFSGDELTYLGLKYEMDLSSYTDAQIDLIKKQDMCSTVKQSMSNYTNAFTNCKQGIENKILVITADFDLDKLVTGDIKKEAKIEDVKAGLEKQNYSCTINNK